MPLKPHPTDPDKLVLVSKSYKLPKLTYDEFIDFVTAKCMYETIYKDSEGRLILVINLLDAYEMANKLKEKKND